MLKQVLVTLESKLPIIALGVWLFIPQKNKCSICAHIYADIMEKPSVFSSSEITNLVSKTFMSCGKN